MPGLVDLFADTAKSWRAATMGLSPMPTAVSLLAWHDFGETDALQGAAVSGLSVGPPAGLSPRGGAKRRTIHAALYTLRTQAFRRIATPHRLPRPRRNHAMGCAHYRFSLEAKLFGDAVRERVFGHGGADLNGRETGRSRFFPKALSEEFIAHKKVLQCAFWVAGLASDSP